MGKNKVSAYEDGKLLGRVDSLEKGGFEPANPQTGEAAGEGETVKRKKGRVAGRLLLAVLAWAAGAALDFVVGVVVYLLIISPSILLYVMALHGRHEPSYWGGLGSGLLLAAFGRICGMYGTMGKFLEKAIKDVAWIIKRMKRGRAPGLEREKHAEQKNL